MSYPPPPVDNAGRYAHIDALRAVAVMLVVVSHAELGHIASGNTGVTIFFAISGFIITFLLLREHDRTGGFRAGAFYLRRALKIGPPLLVVVLIPTVLYGMVAHIDAAGVAAQVGFVYNWFVSSDLDVLPGSGIVWSLAIEEQFYIVFAVLWLFAARSARYRTHLTVVASVVVAASLATKLVLVEGGVESGRITHGSDTRADVIALGVLAAVAYHRWCGDVNWAPRLRRLVSSSWVPAIAGAIYLSTLMVRDPWFRDTFRCPLQGVATCLLILFGLLAGAGKAQRAVAAVSRWRLVNILGLASYSIYLAHLEVTLLLRTPLQTLPQPLRILVLVVAGTAAGVVVWAVVERPVERFRARLRSATPTGQRPGGADVGDAASRSPPSPFDGEHAPTPAS